MTTARYGLRLSSEGVHRQTTSVVVPAFHYARSWRQTLESVLSQDPGPEVLEIEVVDDHLAQDDSESVVRAVAGERARFFRQTHELGSHERF